MNDPIFERFLLNQMTEGLALSRESDILDLHPVLPDQALPGDSAAGLGGMTRSVSEAPLPGSPPAWLYMAVFHCHGLVRVGQELSRADRFEVAVRFQPSYLRLQPKAPDVLYWIGPPDIFHPNVRPPFICPGRLHPGLPLCDLLYQVFEIISYQKVNPREDDALNPDACAWARNHPDRLPVDPRPLKRRDFSGRVSVDLHDTGAGRLEPPPAAAERSRR